MKINHKQVYLLTLFIGLFSGFTLSAKSNGIDPKFLLIQNQAGPIKIGMCLNEAYAVWANMNHLDIRKRFEFTSLVKVGLITNTRMVEETGIALYFTPDRKKENVGLILQIDTFSPRECLVVKTIRVRSPRFRTLEGIGIGSMLSEIKKIYQAVPVAALGTGIVYQVKTLHMGFETNQFQSIAGISISNLYGQ